MISHGRKQRLRLIALFLFHFWIVFFSGILPAFSPVENSRPAFYNNPDKTLNTCILQWNLRSLENKWDLSIRDAPIFFPCSFAKFFSEHLFAHMVYAFPISLSGASPEIVYNVTYQLNRFTIGVAASFLSLEIGSAFMPALIAGALLMTSWKLGQIQNTGLCWALLAMLFFIRHWKRPGRFNALMIALFGILTGLSSGYLAFYTPLALFFLLVVRVLYDRKWPNSIWMRQIAVAAVLICIGLAPTMLGYKAVQEKYGLVRQDYHAAVLVLPFGRQQPSQERVERIAFTPTAWAQALLLVCAIAMILLRRLKFEGWELAFASLAILSFWMAFFEFSPYELIARLPGFNGLRAAYRWYFLWIAALTVVVSMVMTEFHRKIPTLARVAFIVIAFALIVSAVMPQTEISNLHARLPESRVYSFLQKIQPGPICILPIQSRGRILYRIASADRMLYQLSHSFPMISGYSGYIPPITHTIENRLIHYGPSRQVIVKLAKTGVRYIVVDNLLGDASEILNQLRSQANCKILYDQEGEMVAELPKVSREEDRNKLLDLWISSQRAN